MTLRIRHLVLVALLLLAVPAGAAAQSSEDTSGADQYTEQGIPGAEDETTSDEPTEPAPDPDPSPAPAPSGSSGVEPTAETAVTGETTSLPRTGADAPWLALVAAAFLGCGFLLRRALPHQSG
jgi:LPXTG-motif cell wall-anchored protein